MKLKIALIGAAGYWGKNYLRILSQHENVSDILVCDINQKNLDVVKTNYPELETTTSIDDVMKSNCDAVIICTPVSTHFELAEKMLYANKHILVEKPLTDNTESALELCMIAEQNELIILTGQTFIYNSIVQRIKKILDNKELGDLLYLTFLRVGKSPLRFDCNSLTDLGSHDLSMLLYWLDETPLKVSSFGKSYLQNGIEDVVFTNLEYSNNVIANIHNSWYEPIKQRKVTIVGSEKMLTFDDIARTLIIYDDEGEHKIDVPYDQPLETQLNDFVDCIINNKEPLVDGVFGHDVVRILEYCQTALKQ